MSGWQFWIDRGGTFTDIVARAPDGTLTPHKLLSENPERYGDAAIAGIKFVLGIAAGGPVPPGLGVIRKQPHRVACDHLVRGFPLLERFVMPFG